MKSAKKSPAGRPDKASLRKSKKKNEWPELDWRDFNPAPVIGVDEVGRGCLAGPVYAAAVVLNLETDVSAYTDSKLISELRREELAIEICESHQTGLGFATVEEIDQLNIFRASQLAMVRAIQSLNLKRGHILVDGKFTLPGLEGFQQTALIKGDLRCKPISAASILAKVTRDQLMKTLHQEFPIYGFKQHKGYGTPAHKALIKKNKPCLWHRRTFSGVKEFLQD